MLKAALKLSRCVYVAATAVTAACVDIPKPALNNPALASQTCSYVVTASVQLRLAAAVFTQLPRGA